MAALPLQSNAPVIDCQGVQTNPTTATVMADTGELPSGIYEVLVMCSASATARMQLEHRNAANGASVSDVAPWRLSANAPAEFRGVYFLNKLERLRVMMTANLTGDGEAVIYATRKY
jgi:hypothetical protein